MNKSNSTIVFLLLVALSGLLVLQSCQIQKLKITRLRCDYMYNPIGIDAASPRFTWNYERISSFDFKQGYVQLMLSKDKNALAKEISDDVWCSKVLSTEVPFVTMDSSYVLEPHTVYYWKVIVKDKNGAKKVLSPINQFETAFMRNLRWQAKWISDNEDMNTSLAPMLRKSFEINSKKQIEKARLYISAAGYYDVSINGSPASENIFLAPGYTHYDKRNLYNTYDVTPLIKHGTNVITSVLGNGFYNAFAPVATWNFEQARWRNRASMISELHITYKDETKDIIVTDSTWKVSSAGPYLQNNIYSGETYDANKEIDGWTKPIFDDSMWERARIMEAPSENLLAETEPKIKKIKEIKPISIKSFGDTVFVYDFGVNMTGVCQLKVRCEQGTRIEMQHGELLNSDGRLEMRNLDIYYKPLPGLAFQTDVFISNGRSYVFMPKFSYKGFQYVEIRSSRPIHLDKANITAFNFHSDLTRVGRFSCSNELLNRICEAANQSYLCNIMSIPTDCPQREKNGWTADAHVTMDLGLLNFDGIRFYEKWIDDIIDNQTEDGRISGIIPSSGWGYDDWIGPVWDAAMFIVPMSLYNYYGDSQSIRKIYNTCEKYLSYLATREDNDGCVTYGIGEWVPYKTQTPTEYTTLCYYYLDNLYMSQFSDVLRRDGKKYKDKAEKLKNIINRKYLDLHKNIYANGSQTSLAIALYLGIVPHELEQKVADNLYRIVKENNGYLDFGVIGSKTVLRMLSKYGYAETAYQMASKEKEPSWGAWVKKGFTTMPETWTLSPEFRDASINHMFLGDINAWMYNVLAGINFDSENPGFKHIIIQPHFVEGLNWVKGEYYSVKGLIRSEWKRMEGHVLLEVEIPINTTATIEVADQKITVSGGKHAFKF